MVQGQNNIEPALHPTPQHSSVLSVIPRDQGIYLTIPLSTLQGPYSPRGHYVIFSARLCPR